MGSRPQRRPDCVPRAESPALQPRYRRTGQAPAAVLEDLVKRDDWELVAYVVIGLSLVLTLVAVLVLTW